jgi:hypothetical protein
VKTKGTQAILNFDTATADDSNGAFDEVSTPTSMGFFEFAFSPVPLDFHEYNSTTTHPATPDRINLDFSDNLETIPFDLVECRPESSGTDDSQLYDMRQNDKEIGEGFRNVIQSRRDWSLEPHSGFVGDVSQRSDLVPPCSPGYLDQSQAILFFLNFHRQYIFPSDYFLPDSISINVLFNIVEESVPLRYAMISCSALKYSLKVNPSTLTFAFLCYQTALQMFRPSLDNKKSMEKKDSEIALATALVLAGFEVSHYDR